MVRLLRGREVKPPEPKKKWGAQPTRRRLLWNRDPYCFWCGRIRPDARLGRPSSLIIASGVERPPSRRSVPALDVLSYPLLICRAEDEAVVGSINWSQIQSCARRGLTRPRDDHP